MKSLYKNKNPENPTFSFFPFSMYFKEYTTIPRSVSGSFSLSIDHTCNHVTCYGIEQQQRWFDTQREIRQKQDPSLRDQMQATKEIRLEQNDIITKRNKHKKATQ